MGSVGETHTYLNCERTLHSVSSKGLNLDPSLFIHDTVHCSISPSRSLTLMLPRTAGWAVSETERQTEGERLRQFRERERERGEGRIEWRRQKGNEHRAAGELAVSCSCCKIWISLKGLSSNELERERERERVRKRAIDSCYQTCVGLKTPPPVPLAVSVFCDPPHLSQHSHQTPSPISEATPVPPALRQGAMDGLRLPPVIEEMADPTDPVDKQGGFRQSDPDGGEEVSEGERERERERDTYTFLQMHHSVLFSVLRLQLPCITELLSSF
ncbi:hypothetical protein JZ751_008925 [Albula glossodonta]|uniref:Uncharacterized protein n=1 Tax=Albula glossodonta TaxID=121402 RepID=A0A8T2P227_9TELE|nr:hypothetical protein JZ751_008925 [Albula glossodonta]